MPLLWSPDHPPLEHDLTGCLLGERYSVKRLLASGGMARVYAGRDCWESRAVVVKVPRPFVSLDRFARELLIGKRLAGPGLCTAADGGFLPDRTPYLIFDLLDGETLAECLKHEAKLPWPLVVALVRRMVAAARVAHEAGVIHRDVKPENIVLLKKTGEPVLVDFGVAHLVGERITDECERLGTPRYMAPEQASEAAGVDGRADLYSIGVTMFEMLAGPEAQPIISGDGVPRYDARDIRAKLAKVPEPVVEFVIKMTRRPRNRRYENAAAALAALDEIVATNEDVRAAKLPLPKRLRPARRPVLPRVDKALVRAAAVASVVLVMMALTTSWWRGGGGGGDDGGGNVMTKSPPIAVTTATGATVKVERSPAWFNGFGQ